jgi:hypothetical protein
VTTLLILYLVCGAGLALLAIPLIQDKIKPNGLYGFRVKTTLENPKIWYAVNHHFGWRLLVCGLATMVAAVGLYFIPGITLDQYALAALFAFAVFFGVGLVQSIRYMNRLKEESL